MSKVKYDKIYRFLEYDFLYPVNTNFSSKTNSKNVIVVFSLSDLEIRSKDEYEKISEFFGNDSYTLSILIFPLKPIVKKLRFLQVT
jgi:hypothetical protein